MSSGRLVFHLLPVIACCGNISNATAEVPVVTIKLDTINYAQQEFRPVVKTSAGEVEGFFPSAATKVSTFLGIPYAEPPIGEQRWMQPVPKLPWSERRNATEHSKSCMQKILINRSYTNETMSEDCLYLNVYTPATTDFDNKAVMLWVHGGGYNRGSAFEYDPTQLAARGDVVVVTINYRVGIFGSFDADGDGKMDNLGLWDMELALNWVQENIEAFRGDKSRVTIFGGSAGGMAVSQLAISPRCRGLFQRVISESGVMMCPKLLSLNPAATRQNIMRAASCNNLDCLKKMEASKIVQLADDLYDSSEDIFAVSYMFAPHAGDEILPVNPFDAFGYIREQNITATSIVMPSLQDVDLMAGFNSNEGSLILSRLRQHAATKGYNLEDGITKDVIDTFLQEYLPRYFPMGHKSIEKQTRKLYDFEADDEIVSIKRAKELITFYSDLLFKAPTIALLDAHANSNTNKSTYLYLFSQEVEKYANYDRPTWLRGAPHTEEREFVFGAPLSYYPSGNLTAQEAQLSNEMIKAWSNFAKTGDPNNDLSLNWQQYSPDKSFYKEFGASQVELSGNFARLAEIKQWKDVPEPETTVPRITNTPRPAQPVQSKTTPKNEGNSNRPSFIIAVLTSLSVFHIKL